MTWENLIDIPGLGEYAVNQLNNGTFTGIKKKIKEVSDLTATDIKMLPYEAKMSLQYLDGNKYTRAEIESVMNDFFENWCKKYCSKYIIAGSYRRGEEMTGDLDLVVIPKGNPILKETDNLIIIRNGKNKTKLFIKVASNNRYVPVDIIYTNEKHWPAALLYFTGSMQFNIYMRKTAKEKKWRLNEYGLFDNKGKMFNLRTEEAIMRKVLGKVYTLKERSK